MREAYFFCPMLSFSSKLHTHTPKHTQNTIILFLKHGPLLSCPKSSIALQCQEEQPPQPGPSLLLNLSLMMWLVTILAAPDRVLPPPVPQSQQSTSCFPQVLQPPCLSQADPLPGRPSLHAHELKSSSASRLSPSPQASSSPSYPQLK